MATVPSRHRRCSGGSDTIPAHPARDAHPVSPSARERQLQVHKVGLTTSACKVDSPAQAGAWRSAGASRTPPHDSACGATPAGKIATEHRRGTGPPHKSPRWHGASTLRCSRPSVRRPGARHANTVTCGARGHWQHEAPDRSCGRTFMLCTTTYVSPTGVQCSTARALDTIGLKLSMSSSSVDWTL